MIIADISCLYIEDNDSSFVPCRMITGFSNFMITTCMKGGDPAESGDRGGETKCDKRDANKTMDSTIANTSVDV